VLEFGMHSAIFPLKEMRSFDTLASSLTCLEMYHLKPELALLEDL